MQRRTFITTSALGLAAGLSGAGDTLAKTSEVDAADAGQTGHITLPPLKHRDFPRNIPANRPRVEEVLKVHKIDAFVALRPHNVFYFTNADPVLTTFKVEYPAFAVVASEPSEPYVFIGSTGSTWELGRDGRQKPDAVIAFSGAKNWADYLGADAEHMKQEPVSYGGDYNNAVSPDGVHTVAERWWRTAQDAYNPASAPSQAWAVVQALKQIGVTRGVVATDDMRVAYLLSSIGFDAVTVVPGDNVMRQIRQVKSDYEIELIRIAQQATQDSIMASARALEVGMTYDDFRRQFFTEAQARDCEPGFVLLGVTQGMLPDPTVTQGRCYMIDSSARYRNYMGDFARTVTIGEPSKLAQQRFAAQQIGREAGMNIVKPGVMRSLVEKTAREAMIKAGMPAGLVPAINMHSVGLEHSDEPARFDSPYAARLDYPLRENMTLTLDLPFLEIGWGAGHNEDMIRITSNGFEFLNDTSNPLIVV